MGISRIKQTVLKQGEWAYLSSETYYGGSPMGINRSGEIVLAKHGTLTATKTDTTAVSYVGVAFNPSAVDAKTKDYKMTFLPGPGVYTFTKNVVSDNNATINVHGTAGQLGDDYPYDTTLTWTAGDLLYVDTAGLWTNVNPVSGDPCYGVVLDSGTNYITCLLYGGPCAVY